jgi:hypothetical protein
MRTRVFGLTLVAALAVALAVGVSDGSSAGTRKVISSITLSLTAPPFGQQSGHFSGSVGATRKFCRGHRSVTLFPTSSNFPNTTGYVRHVKTNSTGAYGGTYTVPKKPGTYSFAAVVAKTRRTHKGLTYLCKGSTSSAASVTTTP